MAASAPDADGPGPLAPREAGAPASRQEGDPAGPPGGAQPAAPPQEDGHERAAPSRMVLFRAGGERFAVPLEAIREVVVPQPPFARVPRAVPAVRGAMNLRGRVVAVVELAPLLGFPPDPLGPAQGHVLILDRDRRGLGLLVSSVLGVDTLAEPVRCETRERDGLVRGVAVVRGLAVTVLDADALEARAAALFEHG